MTVADIRPLKAAGSTRTLLLRAADVSTRSRARKRSANIKAAGRFVASAWSLIISSNRFHGCSKYPRRSCPPGKRARCPSRTRMPSRKLASALDLSPAANWARPSARLIRGSRSSIPAWRKYVNEVFRVSMDSAALLAWPLCPALNMISATVRFLSASSGMRSAHAAASLRSPRASSTSPSRLRVSARSR